jgi:hypothetical protein
MKGTQAPATAQQLKLDLIDHMWELYGSKLWVKVWTVCSIVLGYDELILARIYVIFVSFCPEFLENRH